MRGRVHRQGCLGKYHDYLRELLDLNLECPSQPMIKGLVPMVALLASGRLLEKWGLIQGPYVFVGVPMKGTMGLELP